MTSTRVDTDASTQAPAAPIRRPSSFEVVRVLLIASLLGGAALHAAVVREHVDHWPAAGLFFVVLAASGLVVGAALLRRVNAQLLLAALALSVGPLLVWLVSRTAGLPFGPEAWEPEQVGLTDSAAGLLELAAAGAALILLRASPQLRARAKPAAAQLVGLVLIAVVTALGVTSAAVAPPAHPEDQPHGQVGSGHGDGDQGGENI
jgi:hypothetical protein